MIIRHLDLSKVSEDTLTIDQPVLTVFWWRSCPLGMLPAVAEELPFSRGTLHYQLARLSAQQCAARNPLLGAPLAAGSEGSTELAVTIDAARGSTHLLDWLDQASEPSQESAELLSIIVCTRDRGEALRTCLGALCEQTSRPGEIIVVDNSADGNARLLCTEFSSVKYIGEPRPGLSFARNAGVRAASGEFIAFTDDDVRPDAGWTAELVKALAAGDADAVTGLVLPLSLKTEAQRLFQFDMGGFGTSFLPAVFDTRFFDATCRNGAHVWRIGAGANMAFRRSVFEQVGLFDTRLGAGASGCSEDSELWYRLLAHGGKIVYEPRIIVHHEHRRDLADLHRQVRAYLTGHVSALVAQADRFGHPGNIRRIFRQVPRSFARTMLRSILDNRPERRRLLLAEIAGWTVGLRYLILRNWREAGAEIEHLKPAPRFREAA